MGWLMVLAEQVFAYFNVECGKVQAGLKKQMLNITTLENNDFIARRGGEKFKFVVSELIDVQKGLKEKLYVGAKGYQISNLKVALLKKKEGTNSNKKLINENATLHERVTRLKAEWKTRL